MDALEVSLKNAMLGGIKIKTAARTIDQIDVEDLELMAKDMSGSERSSAAKKVRETIRDMPDLLRRQDALLSSDTLL